MLSHAYNQFVFETAALAGLNEIAGVVREAELIARELKARKIFGLATLLLWLVGMAAPAALAQGQTEILGTVTDASGAVISGAEVKITSDATGQTRSVTTNDSGEYVASGLNVGVYTVRCTRDGFKESVRTSIQLNVNDTLRINFQMQPGAVGQSVTVQAYAVQVQSDSNEVSNLISGKQISQLDINGRNVVALTQVTPGVTSNAPDFNLPTETSNYTPSVNGMNPANNVWLIDGAEAYDRGDGGDLNIAPSPDALAEFKVLTSNYTPDYGFGSGGTVTMVTKSGSRDFHGGAWEYFRNDDLDADSYFANLAGTPTPELRFNTFGGNIGGPLFIPGHYNKDRSKTFFFVNEEWRRVVLGAEFNDTVPGSAERGGNFTADSPIYVPSVGDPAEAAKFAALGLTEGEQFPGNVIPSSLLDTNVQSFLNAGALPLPTSGSQYIDSARQTVNLREDIVRIDHKISDKLMLMGHFMHDGDSQFFPAIFGGVPTVGFPLNAPVYNAVIKLTDIIRPNLINEFALNFNEDALYYSIAGTYKLPDGWSVQKFFTGNDPNDRLPTVALGEPYSTMYDPGFLPYNNNATSYQERDDLSWSKGLHNFKFGGSFLHYTKNQVIGGDTEGDYTFNGSYTASYAAGGGTLSAGNSFADMLMGFTENYTEEQLQDRRHYRENFASMYAMDDWHIRPRLTLNLGVRYELLPHSYEKYNRLSNFVPGAYNYTNQAVFNADGSISSSSPGVGSVAGVALSSDLFYLNGIAIAGTNGTPSGLVNNYYGTVQPRIGFALDLFGNGRSILRGGGGIFFNQIEGEDIYNASTNPPFSSSPSVNNVYFSNPSRNTVNGLTYSSSTFPILPEPLTSLTKAYPVPETAMYSLGVQQQVTSSTVFTLGYVGNASWHQYMQRSINTVPLDDPNRLSIASGTYNPNLDRIYTGFAAITQQETTGNANYNSLQTTLRIENVHHLSAQFAYTWSKIMNVQTVAQNLSAAPLSDPFDTKFDYGPGDLDQRNVFVANYIYQLPFAMRAKNLAVRDLLGGWQISGITSIQSGFPTTPTLGIDNLGLGGGVTARPNVAGALSYPKSRTQWFNQSAYAAPAALSFGDASRDSIRLPGRDNWNIALFKTFSFNHDGNVNLQFRADAYNTFNHTQFQSVDAGFNDAQFGQVTSTWDPRVFQLSLRMAF